MGESMTNRKRSDLFDEGRGLFKQMLLRGGKYHYEVTPIEVVVVIIIVIIVIIYRYRLHTFGYYHVSQ